MAHVLAKLRGARLVDVKAQLDKDAASHADQGMYLEHLWQNAEDPAEVLFLFQVTDLDHCRQLVKKNHAQARRQDPAVSLPEMIFLEGL
ncbi:hypothetical protein [Polaromonas sp. JS666]|uniref:hypothetical protein n=1 Tax=Polaromonas sp. (strain JS666 / ATCC BAA-500) TaxID=296591 RepID=UPI0000464FDE|nr:hypothetical protein [Polaromonas sp. JS666]ABE45051.1 hypothetical protein Bpro_3137 [Polaromonas sp. JS666]